MHLWFLSSVGSLQKAEQIYDQPLVEVQVKLCNMAGYFYQAWQNTQLYYTILGKEEKIESLDAPSNKQYKWN